MIMRNKAPYERVAQQVIKNIYLKRGTPHDIAEDLSRAERVERGSSENKAPCERVAQQVIESIVVESAK